MEQLVKNILQLQKVMEFNITNKSVGRNCIMKINYCDALVIGGGLAGLRAAVAAQKKRFVQSFYL